MKGGGVARGGGEPSQKEYDAPKGVEEQRQAKFDESQQPGKEGISPRNVAKRRVFLGNFKVTKQDHVGEKLQEKRKNPP